KWGAVGTTTAVPMLTDMIQPDSDPLLYGDNADVTAAMQAGQIDAALFDCDGMMCDLEICILMQCSNLKF
ncbi:MAG: hypothetical protein AAFO75_09920, partial [Pseudomonadota bacterium]